MYILCATLKSNYCFCLKCTYIFVQVFLFVGKSILYAVPKPVGLDNVRVLVLWLRFRLKGGVDDLCLYDHN